jgi:hypothetical protein
MRTIFKYPLCGEMEMPIGATVRKVGEQSGTIMIWAEVDPCQRLKELRAFVVYGTGHSIEEADKLQYLDTVFMGPLVWHVYEVNP